jgi:hypothetical protein
MDWRPRRRWHCGCGQRQAGFLADQALVAKHALLDLRPLRALRLAAVRRMANANLRRLGQGFDAMVVLTGSKPSSNPL